MYVCYLDDSYANDGAVITLAGYAAPEAQWRIVESEMAAVFQSFGVDQLHAMDFHRRKGCFVEWSKSKRGAFVHAVGMMTRDLTMAMSLNVHRANYRARQAELNVNAGMSAYGVAFAALVHAFSRGNSMWETFDREGLRFVVEHGNQNNAEIAIHFERLQSHAMYGSCLKSIDFSEKNGSRAIQLADFFAFYSRRWADRSIANGSNPATKRDEELAVIDQYLPHHMRVVHEAYAGEVTDLTETVFTNNRPGGPMLSEKPVTPRPMRRGDKRRSPR